MPPDVIEFEMVEHFGGLADYREADYWTAKRHEMVWHSKKRAEATQAKRQQEAYERQQRNG